MTTTISSSTPQTYALDDTSRACPACGVLVRVKTAAMTAGGREVTGHVVRFEGGRWDHNGVTGGERVGPGPIVQYPIEPTPVEGRRASLVAAVRKSQAERGGPSPLRWVEMARCNDCARREDRAGRLLATAPGVIARCGTVALDHLTSALDGLAAMRAPIPTKGDPVVVSGLIAHLLEPGRHAGWSSRISPFLAGGDPNVAQAVPWGHLTDTDRAELRAGYAHVLAERVAATDEPVDVPSPGQGVRAGCCLCGIGSVRVHAVKVYRAGGVKVAQGHEWREVEVPDVGSIGARVAAGYRKQTLTLCAKCAEVVDGAGAVGETAMQRSLTRHLAATGQGDLRPLVEGTGYAGLVGWGALAVTEQRAGRVLPPNDERWGHVSVEAARQVPTS